VWVQVKELAMAMAMVLALVPALAQVTVPVMAKALAARSAQGSDLATVTVLGSSKGEKWGATKGSNVKKLTGMTGVGLRVAGDGRMRPAVVRPDLSKLNLKHGKRLRMSGGALEMCGGSMNDKFLFRALPYKLF